MMGGEEKDSGPDKGHQPRQSCEVSDAEISKLLSHFTSFSPSSAELLPQSSEPAVAESGDAKKDPTWQEVLTSLKHLHVRRPEPNKHSRKRAPRRGRRAANMLNLAIAAGSVQKPIVWPARLNSEVRRATGSVLQPPRLSVPCSLEASSSPVNRASGATCCSVGKKTMGDKDCRCNPKYKIRKQNGVREKVCPSSSLFGHGSSLSGLSFSSLGKQQSVTGASNWGSNLNKANHAVSSPGCEPGTTVATISSSSTTREHQHLHHQFPRQQLFSNAPLLPLPSMDELSSGSTLHQQTSGTSASPYAGRPSTSTPLTSGATSISPQPILRLQYSPTANASPAVGRSCSQEMRDMEDTNVNELASYLEDLLHIPRKMSSMAEMMYA